MSNCCANSASVLSPRTAAKATFALKAGVWFRRGRLVMVSPVRHAYWPLAGRNSTYPDVQISRASSVTAYSSRTNPNESTRNRGAAWAAAANGAGLDIVNGHGRIQEGEQVMGRTVEGSCSRLQQPELPHGFWCSP